MENKLKVLKSFYSNKSSSKSDQTEEAFIKLKTWETEKATNDSRKILISNDISFSKDNKNTLCVK